MFRASGCTLQGEQPDLLGPDVDGRTATTPAEGVVLSWFSSAAGVCPNLGADVGYGYNDI